MPCLPPNSHVESQCSMLEGMFFGKWWGLEGEGMCALIRENPTEPLLLREDTMRGPWPGREPSPDHAGTLILDFWPLLLWNKRVLFISYLIYDILLEQTEWTNILPNLIWQSVKAGMGMANYMSISLMTIIVKT